MSKKKNIWAITVIEKNTYLVTFDIPVTKDDAIWQYEAQDDNIVSVEDRDFEDTLEVVKAE